MGPKNLILNIKAPMFGLRSGVSLRMLSLVEFCCKDRSRPEKLVRTDVPCSQDT